MRKMIEIGARVAITAIGVAVALGYITGLIDIPSIDSDVRANYPTSL